MSIEPSNLHALKIGEILDRAFRLYRKNFWLFTGTAGVLLIPLLMLELLSQYFFSDVNIITFVESIFITYLLTGALLWAASRAYFGHPVLINDAYGQARRFIGAFFVANVMQGLAYIPLVILLFLVLMFFGVAVGGNQALSTMVAVIVGAPIAIALSTRWGVVLSAIMFENLSGGNGMRRSWFLTTNEFWHTLVPLLASNLLTYLIVALPTWLTAYVIQLFSIPELAVAGTMGSLVLAQLGQIIALPLTLSIQVVLYYDLRVRREGYDLELALQANAEEDSQGQEIPV